MKYPPAKPDGCAIEEIQEFDGRIYRWKGFSGGVFRYVVAAFLGVWLCGWAFGWVMVFKQLVQNNPIGGPIQNNLNANRVFMIIWLCGWTLGGVIAMNVFWQLVRPSRPEEVTLGDATFRYDPGSFSYFLLMDPWYATRHSNPQAMFRQIFKPRKPILIPKAQMGPVVLERVGERQRLRFDNGAERVEIGEYLKEPEREWLAAEIEAWKAD